MLPPLASGLSPLATAATRSRRRLPGTTGPRSALHGRQRMILALWSSNASGGAQTLLDEGLAGGLGHARSDRQVFGEEAGVVHLMAMVVEVGPSAVGAIAKRLRQGGAPREGGRFLDEPVGGCGILLELGALLMLPARALVLGIALRIARLRKRADILADVEEVEQLALGMLFEEAPVAGGAVSNPR